MERIISDEEKIRKAIEISRRRNNQSNFTEDVVYEKKEKKEKNSLKKIVTQLIICSLIYIIMYLISTTNYSFSNYVVNSVKGILDYDLNFEKVYIDIIKLFKFEHENDNITENIITENIENTGNNSVTETNSEISNYLTQTVELNISENIKEKTEEDIMKENAQKIKKICDFIKPIENGVVSSEFGAREVVSPIMSSNHKGIDIAATTGTEIKSAISGKVIFTGENSSYGKYVKVATDDIITVYAHCSKITVKEGENVEIGQTIALVGSTGNSTGPHLHFEIQYLNENINPRYIIEF